MRKLTATLLEPSDLSFSFGLDILCAYWINLKSVLLQSIRTLEIPKAAVYQTQLLSFPIPERESIQEAGDTLSMVRIWHQKKIEKQRTK